MIIVLKRIFCFATMLLSLFILLGCESEGVNDTNIDHTIKSKENLINILSKHKIIVSEFDVGIIERESIYGSSTTSESVRNYSRTNTQVNGVDEADIVKTDGTYIYLAVLNKVIIAKAYHEEDMEVVKTIEYEDFAPKSLYVDDTYLVVLGSSYKAVESEDSYFYTQPNSRVIVYNKSDFSVKDIIDIGGYTVTSRKINEELLLVTNQYVNYTKGDKDVNLPSVTINEDKKVINYSEIHYVEGVNPNAFVSLIKVNLDDLNYQNYTYLGSSSNVYVSMNNVFVAENVINDISAINNESRTAVTKIDYSDGNFGVSKSVVIKGYINNQFSMDEYNGMFRVATTTGWNDSENNLYIYDENLRLISKLEGIAKDERIQSVRFLGERIYIVTFRQIDPFFVIDVSNATNPKILGELKIPGYSTYLHPYDKSHIIGFGFDTLETSNGVRISGIKMTMFDVVDPSEPKTMFNEVLNFGDNSYGYSELSYNHKALLFNKDKNLFAFPLMFTKYTKDNLTYSQSYKVYNIDLESGFTFKTDISHFDEAKENGYQYGYKVLRGLYIEDTLYTVSYSRIMAHSLTSYKELNTLDLEIDESQFYHIWYGGL